jgi:acetyl/propionyl-CoA carboxylase alpha subunit
VTDGRLEAHVQGNSTNGWRAARADGRIQHLHTAVSSEGVWVHVDGDVFLLDASHPGRPVTRSSTTGSDHELTAPMPATVLSVVATPGSTVAAGDVLLILEAMKMELPVRAPRAATVTAVHCREGELVQPGVPLVDLS